MKKIFATGKIPEKGIKVTNTPDILTETTAELAWALLFSVARKVVQADKKEPLTEVKS